MDLTDALLEEGTREGARGGCLPWAPLPWPAAAAFGAASRLAARGAVIGDGRAAVLASADFVTTDLAAGFDFFAVTTLAAVLAGDLATGLAGRAFAATILAGPDLAGIVLAVPERCLGFDSGRLAGGLTGRFAVVAFTVALPFDDGAALPPRGAVLLGRRVSFAML